MTRKEIAAALTIAKSDRDLSEVDYSVLTGVGLPGFKPVDTTIEIVAKLLRDHVVQFNGLEDSVELDNVSWCLKRRVRIVG